MHNNNITIESFEELNTKIKTMEFSVKWVITSDIGPDWIGSTRTIDFYLDHFIWNETEFSKVLKNKLIKLLSIPSESKDYIINGHGIITPKNGKLEIHYSWDTTIPYQEPSQSKEGILLFSFS